MKARLARPGDAFPAGGAWTPAQLAGEIGRPGSALFVLEGGGGYALFRVHEDRAELLDVLVEPRGRGLGERLLRQALEAVGKRVELEVSERNEPAKRLYAKLGFKIVGRRPKFYNDGSDALLMDLSP